MLSPSFAIQHTLLQVRAQLYTLHQATLHTDLQGHHHPIPFSLLLEHLLLTLDQLDQDLERLPPPTPVAQGQQPPPKPYT